jgi:aminoglycoside phosphotransferase (APT) family kinase protein
MIVAVSRAEVTADVAARLVAGQFPQWADLPVVPVKLNGWDNTTFRLGEELSLRLPSADWNTAQVAKEHRWLPVLAPSLPLPVPELVAAGNPTSEFPRPWSVYRWIAGEPAAPSQVRDQAAFASGLARFLSAPQALDTAGGPPAGAHNFSRGGPLAVYDEQARRLIRLTAGEIDAAGAAAVWEEARRCS